MTHATDLIAAERERQITEEGYTAEHDAGHAPDILDAARAYVNAAWYAWSDGSKLNRPPYWPWGDEYWKPTGDPIRDAVKAAALLAAAIDSLLPDEEVPE